MGFRVCSRDRTLNMMNTRARIWDRTAGVLRLRPHHDKGVGYHNQELHRHRLGW